MNILGSIEIKGRKVLITDQSPWEWQEMVANKKGSEAPSDSASSGF